MALPNGAGGYQVGDGNLTEAVLSVQTIPTTLTGRSSSATPVAASGEISERVIRKATRCIRG